MSHAVTRHFVTIDGRWGPRQVHYRRAGQGPVVVLLHQSPQSSREFIPLMQRWALHFTLIAPDTPGYGQSDPLGPATVGIDMLATALGECIDALGLRLARHDVWTPVPPPSVKYDVLLGSPRRKNISIAYGLIWFSD